MSSPIEFLVTVSIHREPEDDRSFTAMCSELPILVSGVGGEHVVEARVKDAVKALLDHIHERSDVSVPEYLRARDVAFNESMEWFGRSFDFTRLTESALGLESLLPEDQEERAATHRVMYA